MRPVFRKCPSCGSRKIKLVEGDYLTTTRSGKGVGSLLCEAPFGPFRQKTPDPFFRSLAAGRVVGCVVLTHRLCCKQIATRSTTRHEKRSSFLCFFRASLWPFQLGREAPVLSDLGWRFLNGDEQAWSEGGGPGWWLLMLRVQRSQGRERG